MSVTNSLQPLTEASIVPFVSIIMNCYNSSRYLREALDSVLAQTFTDWEVIFWDNQSTDDSADIFKSYADKRFRYLLAPEHTVLGKARNLAVEQARGEWLAFLDCDDLWMPQKLEKQVSIIRKEGCELGLVYGKMQAHISESGAMSAWGRRIRKSLEERGPSHLLECKIFKELLKENFIPLVSAMVRRSAYWSVGGIDPVFKQAEDYNLFLKISKDFKVRAIQEIICSYRLHTSNTTHINLDNSFQEGLAVVERYLPLPEAKQGIKYHQTFYAAYEVRHGNILKGLIRLIRHGDIPLFVSRVAKVIWCYLYKDILRNPIKNAKT